MPVRPDSSSAQLCSLEEGRAKHRRGILRAVRLSDMVFSSGQHDVVTMHMSFAPRQSFDDGSTGSSLQPGSSSPIMACSYRESSPPYQQNSFNTNVLAWIDRVLARHRIPEAEALNAVHGLSGISMDDLRTLTRSDLAQRSNKRIAEIIFAAIDSLEDSASGDSMTAPLRAPPHTRPHGSPRCDESLWAYSLDSFLVEDRDRDFAKNGREKGMSLLRVSVVDSASPPSEPRRRGGRPKLVGRNSNHRRRRSSDQGGTKGRLWQFLIRLLNDERYNPSLIRWEDKDNGIFCFVHGQRVAQMWGEIGANDAMNYEKMTRAIRTYKNGAFAPVPKRLVYRFGDKAQWRQSAAS